MFHASLLMPFKETDAHGPNDTRPPPDIIDDEEEYEVEAILAHRHQGRSLQYLIKWKGYDTSYNTWEPQQNLQNSLETLEEYKRRRNLV